MGSSIKLRWEFNSPNDLLPIPYTGSPYTMLGKREYTCHQGKDRDKTLKEKRMEMKNEERMRDHSYLKRRRHTQSTKKMDCPVKFMVKKIFRFNDVIHKDSKYNREKLNKRIRNDVNKLEQNKTIGVVQYLVLLPKENHINHHKGEAGNIIQPTDGRIVEFIKKQVRSGCRRPKELQSRVETFVKDTIFNGKFSTSMTRKKFSPSRKKIRNIISSIKHETLKSTVDQENIQLSKSDWEGDGGKIFFKPYIQENGNSLNI